MKRNNQFLFLLAFVVTMMTACSKDKNTVDPEQKATKYVIAGSAATAEQSKTYLFLSENLDEGEITVQGNGYETPGSTMYALNNKAFTFQYNKGDPGFTEVFKLNSKAKLEKATSFSVSSVNVFLPYKDEKHLLAYTIGRSLTTKGKAYWINTESNLVDRDTEFDQKIVEVNGKIATNYYAFIYAFFEFGDKLYTVYAPTFGGTESDVREPNDYKDKAFVSIFDKNMKFIKTIVDNRMPYIGKYYNVMGLGQANNGDIYAFSTGDAKTSNNHSAFLKIKNDEFDQNYYWDVEAEAGKRIFFGKHISDSKFILAMIDRDENKAVAEGVKLAIVDVVKKKLDWVSGINGKIAAAAYGFPLFTDKGKAYLPMNGDQASVTNLYVIDPATNSAKIGLKLTGIKEVSGIGVLSN